MSVNEMQALADDAARARTRLIASGENIRAQLSPSALTRQMEQTVTQGARHFAGEVKQDLKSHGGMLAGALIGVGALVFLVRSGTPGRSSKTMADHLPAMGETDGARSKPSPGAKASIRFTLQTLAASLGPLAIGYFLGETRRADDRKPESSLPGLFQGEMARQLWRNQFGYLQRKLVNSCHAPGLAATLMLALGLLAEITKPRKD